jgi:hypothetical protein
VSGERWVLMSEWREVGVDERVKRGVGVDE